MILYKINNQIYYEDIVGTGEIRGVPDLQVEFDNHSASGQITISIFRYQDRGHKNFFRETFDYDQVLDAESVAYGDSFADVTTGFDNGMDVNIQDQTTPVVIAKFSQTTNQTTLSAVGAIGDKTITLTSNAGAVAGKYITLFNLTAERFSLFTQVGAPSGNVITLDTPLDFAYPSGTFVDIGTTNLAVNGSITTQVFGLRGGGTPPGVDLDFDVTRLIFTCLTTTTPILSEFGNITRLVNGLVCRRRDGTYSNIFNVKDNIGIAGIMYDFQLLSAVGQGQAGFWARITFAGQNKMGVAQRLGVGEDMEILIQDNLASGDPDITSLEIVAEGHLVQP